MGVPLTNPAMTLPEKVPSPPVMVPEPVVSEVKTAPVPVMVVPLKAPVTLTVPALLMRRRSVLAVRITMVRSMSSTGPL